MTDNAAKLNKYVKYDKNCKKTRNPHFFQTLKLH